MQLPVHLPIIHQSVRHARTTPVLAPSAQSLPYRVPSRTSRPAPQPRNNASIIIECNEMLHLALPPPVVPLTFRDPLTHASLGPQGGLRLFDPFMAPTFYRRIPRTWKRLIHIYRSRRGASDPDPLYPTIPATFPTPLKWTIPLTRVNKMVGPLSLSLGRLRCFLALVVPTMCTLKTIDFLSQPSPRILLGPPWMGYPLTHASTMTIPTPTLTL